jgi:hypothetical protein
MKRDLLTRTAHLCAEVAPLCRDQLLPGDEPEPEKRRHARVGGIPGGAPKDLELSFLQYVRRINPPLETAVQSQAHHAAKLFAMPREQLGQRLSIPDARSA